MRRALPLHCTQVQRLLMPRPVILMFECVATESTFEDTLFRISLLPDGFRFPRFLCNTRSPRRPGCCRMTRASGMSRRYTAGNTGQRRWRSVSAESVKIRRPRAVRSAIWQRVLESGADSRQRGRLVLRRRVLPSLHCQRLGSTMAALWRLNWNWA